VSALHSEVRAFRAETVARLDRHAELLGDINGRLNSHDQRLNGIDQRLDGIDQRLDGIDQRLESHGEMLQELLRRLPPAAD
jgi:archaellum component FlaC